MKKTLFVTDLDGTLFRGDKTISEETIKTINGLIEEGMYFTFATARSIHSAARLTSKLKLQLPVITRNGAVLAEQQTGKELEVVMFSKDNLTKLRQKMEGLDLYGFVTGYVEGRERKSYLRSQEKNSAACRQYLLEHEGDERLRPVDTIEEVFAGEICYFTYMADKEDLDPFYERIRDEEDWICIYQKDMYHPEHWLEIGPKEATKANAIKALQKRLGCERLVVFGDSINDISMFQVADEAYVVENAISELKALATDVILSNEEDGVARCLKSIWEKNK